MAPIYNSHLIDTSYRISTRDFSYNVRKTYRNHRAARAGKHNHGHKNVCTPNDNGNPFGLCFSSAVETDAVFAATSQMKMRESRCVNVEMSLLGKLLDASSHFYDFARILLHTAWQNTHDTRHISRSRSLLRVV